MRILHLSSEYPPAPIFGLGRYVHELAEAQFALGHKVEICTNSLSGKEHETVRCGVVVKRAHFPPPPKAPTTAAMLLHFNLQLVERILEERLISGTKAYYGVINAHDWLTFPAAFHICRLLKCPLVTTIHDVIFNKVRSREFTSDDAYIAGIENWACHASNRVIVLSSSVKQEIVSAYHVDPEKISVVPAGVSIAPLSSADLPELTIWRRKILPDQEHLLLYAGRLDPEKGLFVLLEAVKELAEAVPNGWRLVLAGRGQLKDSIEEFVTRFKLKNRVALLGYLDRDELRIAYAAADVLVVPSEYEPYGLVALEGQRLGTPVIVSEVGGLTETIQRTKGGLIFPVGNAQSLRKNLEILLADHSLRKKYGVQGQRNTEQLYNWKGFAAQLDIEYSLVKNNPPPENIPLPEWTHPDRQPRDPESTYALQPKKLNIVAKPDSKILSQREFEQNNIVIFWHHHLMHLLKPILENLINAHALNVLHGVIQVMPVLDSDSTTTAWTRPYEHPNVVYIQEGQLELAIENAAAVIAPSVLAPVLIQSGAVNPAQIPTIWVGGEVTGAGWGAATLDEIFALANKLLCDERLRKALALDLRNPIPQLPARNRNKQKRSVLHILPQIVTGGAETMLLELIKGTLAGVEHAILCLGICEGPLPDEFKRVGIEIHRPNCQQDIFQVILRQSADILHLHSMSYIPGWIPIHRKLAAWTILESEHVVGIGSGHFGPVDFVTCVSYAVRDFHLKYEGAWRQYGPNFSVVYNGLDLSDYQSLPTKSEARALIGLPLNRPIVGRVSALARNKCVEAAIDDVAELINQCPQILFVIVGDGDQRKQVEQWVSARGLTANIRFLGERRDIPLILRSFDVFAYHTQKEALGNVILEAVAAGVPVVASNVEGTWEALNGAPGELFTNGESKLFADAVIRWLKASSPSTPYELTEQFTRQYMGKKYESLYNQYLKVIPPTMDDEVTVLIPFFNPRIAWLTEALDSVARQTFTKWKILLIDDGSSEEVKTYIHELISKNSALSNRSRVLTLPGHQGLPRALNAGLQACDTELIARLDADDRMAPNRLQVQVDLFRRDPSLTVVGGCARLINESGEPTGGRYIYPEYHTDIAGMLGKSCAFAHPAVMYRKSIVLGVGGYRQGAKHYEDYDLWVRLLARNAHFANISADLIDYRVHKSSISNTKASEQAKGACVCATSARITMGQLRVLSIAVFCPWKRDDVMRFPYLGINLHFNPATLTLFDAVLDLDKPFTSESSKFNPERRFYATTEPAHFANYTKSLVAKIDSYYPKLIFSWHSQLRTLDQCRVWHGTDTWIQQRELIRTDKIFGLGGVVSGKWSPKMEGYALRRELLDRQNEITIPGRVYNPTKRWHNEPVAYPIPNKLPAMDFMFQIAIENCCESDYFTEKLIDVLVSKCVPLYFGDPLIGKKFDLRGIILLDPKHFINQINSLTPSDYLDRLPFIEENYERSKLYLSREQQLAEHLALELL